MNDQETQNALNAAKAKWQAVKDQHFKDVAAGHGELHTIEWWDTREIWYKLGFMDGFSAAPRER